MKKLILLLFVPVFLSTSCYKDPYDPYEESRYQPVLMRRADLEKSIKWIDSKKIVNPGKIYVKDNLLFINEKFEGVHVYDNSDPSNPIALGFMVIPGNLDIAIKGDIVYADNSVDLVTFRFSNGALNMLDRNTNVFPELTPPDNFRVPSVYQSDERPENTVIIKWVEK